MDVYWIERISFETRRLKLIEFIMTFLIRCKCRRLNVWLSLFFRGEMLHIISGIITNHIVHSIFQMIRMSFEVSSRLPKTWNYQNVEQENYNNFLEFIYLTGDFTSSIYYDLYKKKERTEQIIFSTVTYAYVIFDSRLSSVVLWHFEWKSHMFIANCTKFSKQMLFPLLNNLP